MEDIVEAVAEDIVQVVMAKVILRLHILEVMVLILEEEKLFMVHMVDMVHTKDTMRLRWSIRWRLTFHMKDMVEHRETSTWEKGLWSGSI